MVLSDVDDDFSFYFATRDNTFKARAIEQNQKISFTVWAHQKMLVQGKGRVIILSNDRVEDVAEKLVESAAKPEKFWPPILSLGGNSYKVYQDCAGLVESSRFKRFKD